MLNIFITLGGYIYHGNFSPKAMPRAFNSHGEVLRHKDRHTFCLGTYSASLLDAARHMWINLLSTHPTSSHCHLCSEANEYHKNLFCTWDSVRKPMTMVAMKISAYMFSRQSSHLSYLEGRFPAYYKLREEDDSDIYYSSLAPRTILLKGIKPLCIFYSQY